VSPQEQAFWLASAGVPDLPSPAPAQPFREASGTTIDPDEGQWRRLGGDAQRDLAPMTQWRMQRIAHWLWEQNLLANRIIELPVAFLLAEGVRLTTEENDAANQAVLDRFWTDPINDMDLKLPKKVREMALFGEQCYPTFVNELDGMVRIGYLDPALIATVVMDPDNPEQPIGIVTARDSKGNARRYRIIINGPEDVFMQGTQAIRQTFDTGEAFYFRVNDLSSGSRGRSDLLAQADWLDGFDRFLFGELDRQGFLRAFLWDVTLKNADEATVKKRAREIITPRTNSVRVHNDSETWSTVTPGLQAADSTAAAALFRNYILGGASLPPHWFAEGGNVNRAVGAEMAEPTIKVLAMRQRIWKHVLESIGRYVLMKANGEGTDFADKKNQARAIFPEIAAKDTDRLSTALQAVIAGCAVAVMNKLLTRATAIKLIAVAASRLGIEIDAAQELAAAEAEAAQVAAADVFTTPPVADAAPGDGSANPSNQ
jgi:hypothetical protein